jgi:hypothetical protein
MERGTEKPKGQDQQPLTQERDASKWVSLFDGKTLNDWVVDPNNRVYWAVDGNAIVGSTREMVPRGVNIWTSKTDYGNFRFRCEVFISAETRGGIAVRKHSSDSFGVPAFVSGLWVQINGVKTNLAETGSFFRSPSSHPEKRLVCVSTNSSKKLLPNEWTLVEFVCKDTDFFFYVNSVLVNQYFARSEDDQAIAPRGPIELQLYTPGTIKFRNLQVLTLSGKD